jgi:hypothetical protein
LVPRPSRSDHHPSHPARGVRHRTRDIGQGPFHSQGRRGDVTPGDRQRRLPAPAPAPAKRAGRAVTGPLVLQRRPSGLAGSSFRGWPPGPSGTGAGLRSAGRRWSSRLRASPNRSAQVGRGRPTRISDGSCAGLRRGTLILVASIQAAVGLAACGLTRAGFRPDGLWAYRIGQFSIVLMVTFSDGRQGRCLVTPSGESRFRGGDTRRSSSALRRTEKFLACASPLPVR